ncbi:MAG: hypothetical protein NWE99_09580 [Candidatus Bathyarchaeota archaeon]|nr:hypothetical protein [Candidatus Bathyarchaeota archaeon]
MSIGRNFWRWCRIPPEPPNNRHRKLLVGSIVFTILSVGILTSLTVFYSGLMLGQTSTMALPSTILSVVNSGDGPLYIKNATFLAENDNSIVQENELGMRKIIQDEPSNVLGFWVTSGYRVGDSGNINATIANLGDKDLTVTSIEIYRGNYLFASLDGPFILTARTAGIVNLQVYNLTELSKVEAQLITQSHNQQVEDNVTTFAGRVMYTAIVKTSEGITASFDKFLFLTDYFSCAS